VEGPTLALTMSSAGDRAKAPAAIIAASHPRAVADIALHVIGRHLTQDTGEGWGDGEAGDGGHGGGGGEGGDGGDGWDSGDARGSKCVG